jgi:hypothetical protein
MKQTLKKFSSLLMLLICLFILIGISAARAVTYSLVNGPAYTNVNAAYNSGTNGSGAVTNNFQVGVVPGASNVLWYLSGSIGAQPGGGTNGFLPSAGFAPQGNYPGTLYGPWDNTSIIMSGALTATNATSTTITARFAGSIDGAIWYTNYYVQTYIIPVNALTPVIPVAYSNVVTHLPYFALQQIDNPGVAAFTNIVIQASGKSGQ